MNPYASHPSSLLFAGRSLARHRRLIYEMIKREVVGRYRGAALGLLWSFFTPVLMLAVYTFVFGVVFKSRWAGSVGSQSQFAVILFAGMMVFVVQAALKRRTPSA